MNDKSEWNPYYMNASCPLYPQGRMYPWLYPYGNRMNYWNIWDSPESMEMETDEKRLRELYPIMARRMQPYVEETCNTLEYPGSMMYDEYPDQLSLLRKAKDTWELAQTKEDFGEQAPKWDEIKDLIGVLLLQEMMRRRKKYRGSFPAGLY